MNAESLKLELLERVLLNMNYNTSLTSEENKKVVSEQYELKTILSEAPNLNKSNIKPFIPNLKDIISKSRSITIDSISDLDLIKVAKKWGFVEPKNIPIAYTDTMRNAYIGSYAKSFLKKIGWPKFGEPTNFKVDNANPYYKKKMDYYYLMSKTKEQGRLADWKGQVMKTKGYSICLDKIKNDIKYLNADFIESFIDEKEYCQLNAGVYEPPIGVKGDDLLYAVLKDIAENYDVYFESLRDGLTSGVGTTAQIFLSIHPAGRVGVCIAWAVLACYDIFKMIQTGDYNYFVNLLIDILSIFTTGAFAKIVSKIAKPVVKTIEGFFGIFMKQSPRIWARIILLFRKIRNTLGKEMEYVKDAVDFLIKNGLQKFGKYGQKVYDYIVVLTRWIKYEIEFLRKKIGIKAAGYALSKKVLESKIVQWVLKQSIKFDVKFYNYLKSLSSKRVAYAIGKSLDDGTWKACISYAEDELRDKPLLDALAYIDKKFGSEYAVGYATVVASHKLKKDMSKRAFKGDELVKSTIEFESRATKIQSNREKSISGTDKLVGVENPTNIPKIVP